MAFLRWDRRGEALVVLCNFSPVHREGYRVGVPFHGTWTPVFNTDASQFGGEGLGDTKPIDSERIPCHEQKQSMVIDLPPMSAMVYQCTLRFPEETPAEDKETVKPAKISKSTKTAKSAKPAKKSRTKKQ